MSDLEHIIKEVQELTQILFPLEQKVDLTSELFLLYNPQIEDVLTRITLLAEKDENSQHHLGTIDIIRFLTKLLDTPLTPLALLRATLKAWMRILRRSTLIKTTTCWESCDLSEDRIVYLVPCLRKHVDDEVISFYGSSLIMMLASDSDNRKFKFGLIGTSKVILSILRQHRNSPETVEMALRAMRNLSTLDQVASQFASDQGGAVLADLLVGDGDQPLSVLEAILYAIINISYVSENAIKLGQDHLCQALADVACRCIENGLALEVSWSVRNLISAEESIIFFKETAVPHLILSILKESEDVDTLLNALWAVANLSCDAMLGRQLLKDGVVQCFSRIYHLGLNCFPDDSQLGPLCEAMAFAIFNLAGACGKADVQGVTEEIDSNTVEGNIELLEYLGEGGGCELICLMLLRYYEREAMVEACFRALHALAAGCSRNQQALGSRDDCLANICLSTWQHREVAETVYLGWKALLTICSPTNVERNAQLARLPPNVTGHVAWLVRHYVAIEEMVLLGCSILLLLPYFDEEKREILRAGQWIDCDDRIVVVEDRAALLAAWEIEKLAADFPESSTKTVGEGENVDVNN
eukprot:gene53-57_t